MKFRITIEIERDADTPAAPPPPAAPVAHPAMPAQPTDTLPTPQPEFRGGTYL